MVEEHMQQLTKGAIDGVDGHWIIDDVQTRENNTRQ